MDCTGRCNKPWGCPKNQQTSLRNSPKGGLVLGGFQNAKYLKKLRYLFQWMRAMATKSLIHSSRASMAATRSLVACCASPSLFLGRDRASKHHSWHEGYNCLYGLPSSIKGLLPLKSHAYTKRWNKRIEVDRFFKRSYSKKLQRFWKAFIYFSLNNGAKKKYVFPVEEIDKVQIELPF